MDANQHGSLRSREDESKHVDDLGTLVAFQQDLAGFDKAARSKQSHLIAYVMGNFADNCRLSVVRKVKPARAFR